MYYHHIQSALRLVMHIASAVFILLITHVSSYPSFREIGSDDEESNNALQLEVRSILDYLHGQQSKQNVVSDSGRQKSSFNGMNAKETEIFTLINEYRRQNGLSSLQASVNLAFVAHTHAVDVVENDPDVNGGNLHSWSNKGKWTPVTYTSDHRYAKLMWSKPSEISNYKFNGFEISLGVDRAARKTSTIDPRGAVNAWKGSKGHNDVILEQGTFRGFPMKAMGVGIYKGYACVWFGQQIDTYPAPS